MDFCCQKSERVMLEYLFNAKGTGLTFSDIPQFLQNGNAYVEWKTK